VCVCVKMYALRYGEVCRQEILTMFFTSPFEKQRRQTLKKKKKLNKKRSIQKHQHTPVTGLVVQYVITELYVIIQT